MILENRIDDEEAVIVDSAARKDSNDGFEMEAAFEGDDSTWDFQKFIQEFENLVKSTQADDLDGFLKVWNFIRSKNIVELCLHK